MKNQLKTILLLGTLSALLVAFGASLGPGPFWLFTAIAVLMNLGAYFFSDKIVLRMHGARELAPGEAPRLHEIVRELSGRAGIPPPRLFLVDEPHANAFATGRNPQHAVVAVTRGIVDLLDERELRGVIAHELAHVANRDILVASVAAGMAAAISNLANMLMFSSLLGGGRDDEEGGGGGLLMMLVAPIAGTLVQLGISRSREYLADETGARISGDPLALASALEKLQRGAEVLPSAAGAPATASLFIVNPFGAGAVLGGLARMFSTHPPAEERIRRLRELARVSGGADGYGPRTRMVRG
ncbi:zinc metalloprotease HtpX [Anaeromyxobacter dehalogenans]|uniref:Protease HtpX homolog n=1 Tax=Anaeromyxobacter dehalogenans (strain 2CP-C) TaxID=290397 RepID=Q2IJF5_ANADE|nr:zinc metalloprotease HtpX [Anaeromyxobacter dehalogenans]ABC81788.1 Heat shock protein, Metallo peptidase, MEROPS family M48B [Anaeromyxobacter dehalogenans 2CP-C]